MAEPIGLASGILTLATFAFRCSVSLYETVESFRSHPKRVRDLLGELEALSGVLAPLVDLVKSTSDVDLSALDRPLLRCGNACKEFQQEILLCLSRSNSNRTSFRDWARLTYMGDNIDDFRDLLAGYKATINIALTHATLYVVVISPSFPDALLVLITDLPLDANLRIPLKALGTTKVLSKRQRRTWELGSKILIESWNN